MKQATMPELRHIQLMDFGKGRMILFSKVVENISEVARLVDRPRQTVADFLEKCETAGDRREVEMAGRL